MKSNRKNKNISQFCAFNGILEKNEGEPGAIKLAPHAFSYINTTQGRPGLDLLNTMGGTLPGLPSGPHEPSVFRSQTVG